MVAHNKPQKKKCAAALNPPRAQTERKISGKKKHRATRSVFLHVPGQKRGGGDWVPGTGYRGPGTRSAPGPERRAVLQSPPRALHLQWQKPDLHSALLSSV
uniref:Uncharacterized protein n=1 Tax=Gasterosteus aculeatus aculeatus TaxID=481459 RepID=A0AAQ4S8N2_GASAC